MAEENLAPDDYPRWTDPQRMPAVKGARYNP